MPLEWVLCGVLSVIVLVLCVKIYTMKVSMSQIRAELADWLETDTNTLISISSNDRQLRLLAADLNKQLRLLREQRRQYLNGDMELKNAVTNISHDLRTPLTAICGYLDLLEQEEKSDAVKRYTEIIRNRVDILIQLTEELFRYSIVISSENGIVSESVSINEVLEESIAAFYTTLNGRGITPNIRLPENKVIRELDRSALTRVFSNLLNNVVKYSDGDLDIALYETGEIVFSNTASKLSEVQVAKLFDRFYTVESARKSTGLGLAIARTLTLQMGGAISAEYEDGRLSIRILFPLTAD
ncbi:MAG: HAMP domain-containing histidine kinase [Butyrivibrio sp.]|nr:HAMP domain-containing histidine kinase [Butyrivibrio sp.]